MAVVDVLRKRAHLLLGAIRLFNGVAALALPEVTARRLGSDPEANPTAIYPLRMFGVRTIVLGVELLFGDEQTRGHSLRAGRLIHASDTIAAAIGGVTRQLPPRTAALLVCVSAINTTLAFLGSHDSSR